ncbi:hypothetical protein FNF27_03030 [Cafeteria roenbergensis]|uniref:Uncharacterized protein n=1 Tax=Cafeteria roenbergensis TaxID=33653 RepID=A0A5A8EFX0_CAFRO|nr:hypothetical protein FNF27_03030 [Cafeteria roenbergensis]
MPAAPPGPDSGHDSESERGDAVATVLSACEAVACYVIARAWSVQEQEASARTSLEGGNPASSHTRGMLAPLSIERLTSAGQAEGASSGA